MEKPELKKPPASVLPILLAAVAALMAGVALMMLFPWVGWAFLIVAAVFALGAFHYAFWGWWLGRMIHTEVAEEEANLPDQP